MNVFVRFGQWLENRKVVRMPEFSTYQAAVEVLRRKIDVLESEKQIPATLAKDLAIIRARLDRVELTLGFKRDPVAVKVPGAPSIS